MSTCVLIHPQWASETQGWMSLDHYRAYITASSGPSAPFKCYNPTTGSEYKSIFLSCLNETHNPRPDVCRENNSALPAEVPPIHSPFIQSPWHDWTLLFCVQLDPFIIYTWNDNDAMCAQLHYLHPIYTCMHGSWICGGSRLSCDIYTLTVFRCGGLITGWGWTGIVTMLWNGCLQEWWTKLEPGKEASSRLKHCGRFWASLSFVQMLYTTMAGKTAENSRV